MPLKSFQCSLPSADVAIMVHVDQADNSSGSSVAGNSQQLIQVSEKTSDGVQSQAITCRIYSQGTTADHMYVKHTWVSNKPICTVVLLMQNISFTNYFRCTKPPENGRGSIFLSPPGKRQTFFFFFFLKPCYDIICTNTKRTAAFIPQYGFEWNPCLHCRNTAFSPTSP